MKIFVDESGSFVSSTKTDSWNCVVAYMTPEGDLRCLRDSLAKLKRDSGKPATNELKLRDVNEINYFAFLQRLGKLNGLLFAVATDASRNDPGDIIKHQKEQVENITEHKSVMKYESGRQGLQFLADQVDALSPQLYVQLYCQVHLISHVVYAGVLYFVQRLPKALGSFRWRIDQKNTKKIDFEDAFEKVTPALLQSMSLDEPLLMLKGADYSAFEHFIYAEGQAPTYLKSQYGIEVNSGINIGKLIREDLRFEDSQVNQGVQIADLLASGLRRCLRSGFSENRKAAYLLGKLMVQGKDNAHPITLLGFRETRMGVTTQVGDAVTIMTRNSRPMLMR